MWPRRTDELAIIKSLHTESINHDPGMALFFTGHEQPGRPSLGAWVTYGLGSESRSLPGFVVLDSGFIPPGGLDCFHNGFLPATYQGSIFKDSKQPVADIRPTESLYLQQRKLALLRKLDAEVMAHAGANDALESSIRNYELAFRMQAAVPELVDLSQETESTRRLYGLDASLAEKRTYARQCLLARRLVERGVRFVEVGYLRPEGPAELTH